MEGLGGIGVSRKEYINDDGGDDNGYDARMNCL